MRRDLKNPQSAWHLGVNLNIVTHFYKASSTQRPRFATIKQLLAPVRLLRQPRLDFEEEFSTND